jgi:hypothetical protein
MRLEYRLEDMMDNDGPLQVWSSQVSLFRQSVNVTFLSLDSRLSDSVFGCLSIKQGSHHVLLSPVRIGGSTSMDVDVNNVHSDVTVYTRVQQVTFDTDPLMWWKKNEQEFPHLTRMTRQHLTVPVTSVSPERLFMSVGLVKSDFRGSLLDTTLIDVTWSKQAP